MKHIPFSATKHNLAGGSNDGQLNAQTIAQRLGGRKADIIRLRPTFYSAPTTRPHGAWSESLRRRPTRIRDVSQHREDPSSIRFRRNYRRMLVPQLTGREAPG